MAIKLTKTLYIGLGGTGVMSILRTKQCFIDAYGEIPPMIAFLAVDTDKGIRNKTLTTRTGHDVALDDNDICFCGITGSALDIFNRTPSLHSWIPKRNIGNLAGLRGEGAGQVRSNGRFLVRYNSVNLAKTIAGKAAHIAKPLPYGSKFDYDKNTQGMEYPTIVNIVGSVAGGTGSGMLIDILMLTAKALKDTGCHFKIQPWIVLPEVFRNMVPGPASANAYQNTYGAMRELDYLYHMPKDNTNPVDFGFDKINYLHEEIEDAILINNANRSGIVLQHIDDITDSIGRCMFLPSNEISSVTDNTKQFRFTYNIINKEAHYKSAGSAELIYDNQAVGNILARAIISDICDELVRKDSIDAQQSALEWMTSIRIQEHGENMLIDDLLSQNARFSTTIGKDDSIDHIKNSIFTGSESTRITGEIEANYNNKLKSALEALYQKVENELNQQHGVGNAKAFIESLKYGINLSLSEMQDEKKGLESELSYEPDWASKLNDIKPKSFFGRWSQDEAESLASEVDTFISKKRDLLRHTYAIQFYREFLDNLKPIEDNLTLLKHNISEVAKKQTDYITLIQSKASSSSKFQIYLHEEDLSNYRRPDVAGTSAQFRKRMPISMLTGKDPRQIEKYMLDYAISHQAVIDAVNVSIEDKLSSMSDDQLLSYFSKMKEMSSPLWTTNTQGFLSKAQEFTTIFTIGCHDMKDGIIQNRFQKFFTVNNNNPIFVSTRMTDRISFFQTECYSPLFSVSNMTGYMDDANKKLNIDVQYPVCYIDEKLFQRMEVENFEIMPKAQTDTVLPNWIKGIIYDYIKFDEKNQTYFMYSEQGEILDGGYLALGARRDIAFEQFQLRALDKEIEKMIQKEIDQKGRPVVMQKFEHVQNDLKNYLEEYAHLSPVELDRVKVKDPTYQMILDQLRNELSYIQQFKS